LKQSLSRFNRRLVRVMGVCVCLAASWTACTTQSEAPARIATPSPPIVVATPPLPLPQPSVAPARIVKASYQGSATAGHTTASGEPYNPNALTAASRTLPIGSTVKVINPETGRSVKVRINDRGPFVHGRSLDLSKRAAEKVGLGHKGVTKLKIIPVSSHTESHEPESSPIDPTPPSSN
jgi:rare lipoprotein A